MTDDRPPLRRAARARAAAMLLASVLASFARAADAPPSGPALFFQHPRMEQASLSPDGQTVAMLVASSAGGHVRLVALDVKTMKFTALAGYDNADVASLHWVNDHRIVYSLGDRDTPEGDLNGAPGLYGVNIDGSARRELIGRFWKAYDENLGVRARVLPWNTYFLRAADRKSDDVYVTRADEIDVKHVDYRRLQRLNTMSGTVEDVPTPPHAADWLFDSKGQLRVVVTESDDRTKVMTRDPGAQEWVTLNDFREYSNDKSFAPGFIDQDDKLFVEAHNGNNTVAVWSYDLAQRKMADKPWVISPKYDIEPSYVQIGGKLAGLRYQTDAVVTQWLSPELEALQARIDKMLPSTANHLNIASSGNLDVVVVHAQSDRVPGLWFLYDQAKGKLFKLGSAQPDIDPAQMAHMELVHYAARDGLDIPAWLTVPNGAERKNLPLVLLVHGGPYLRGTVWQWNPEVQFLASRGYAVLQPEFRGSTGYGQQLFRAGWKQWGLAMQDDLVDAVKWAVSQGIVDPKRVCIAGASYGGYAVLEGLERDPDVYRCGIDWVGVTDLQLLYTADWSDWSDASKKYYLPNLVGDRVADAEQLKATSPVTNVARIRAPLLMAYGGHDKRVPLEHGESFHEALRKQPGASVEWVVYGKEGHGWRSTETDIDFWNRVAKFLDTNLGH